MNDSPPYRAVRHLSRHVAWPNVIIIWMVHSTAITNGQTHEIPV